MKNKIYISLLGLLLTLFTTAQAQQISFADDTVSVTGFSSDYELVANNDVNNLTNNDLTIVWKRITNTLSSNWTSSVCDKIACWNVAVETKSFVLPANRSENLDVHFFPDNNLGNGFAQLIAYVQGDSLNTVISSVYKANASQVNSISNATKKNLNLSVYPNPVKDYMFINGLPDNQNFKVELYSILGTKVASYNLPAGTSQNGVHEIDMQDLPKGVFMVRVMDKSMNLLFNKSISKMK